MRFLVFALMLLGSLFFDSGVPRGADAQTAIRQADSPRAPILLKGVPLPPPKCPEYCS